MNNTLPKFNLILNYLLMIIKMIKRMKIFKIKNNNNWEKML